MAASCKSRSYPSRPAKVFSAETWFVVALTPVEPRVDARGVLAHTLAHSVGVVDANETHDIGPGLKATRVVAAETSLALLGGDGAGADGLNLHQGSLVEAVCSMLEDEPEIILCREPTN